MKTKSPSRPVESQVEQPIGLTTSPRIGGGKYRLIETHRDIAEGLENLRRVCPAICAMHDSAGDPPLRRNAGGFAGLARIVVGQQVSVASANAIWTRFATIAHPMSPEIVAALSDDHYRAAGLSRPKIKTLRAIATAALHDLDFDRIGSMDEDAARAALTQISGIGPWTADIYLMFCLGRADVFAPGDLALQEAARLALALDVRPPSNELAAIADQRWKPWRGVAARLLWHYYAATKAAKSGPPV